MCERRLNVAIDESKFGTMRLLRCRKCGNVYAAGYGAAVPECPECSSNESELYKPEGSDRNEG